MRATLDWSHALLSGREQALLRRLSVFAGWSLEMAEQVCADAVSRRPRMLDLTSGLVDKSLVVVEPEVLGQARYRLLDTIRGYAAEKLAESSEAAVTGSGFVTTPCGSSSARRLSGWRSSRPLAAAVDVFRRYDADAGNLRQVLSGCLADGDAETG